MVIPWAAAVVTDPPCMVVIRKKEDVARLVKVLVGAVEDVKVVKVVAATEQRNKNNFFL